jgi:hypothetical protein
VVVSLIPVVVEVIRGRRRAGAEEHHSEASRR